MGLWVAEINEKTCWVPVQAPHVTAAMTLACSQQSAALVCELTDAIGVVQELKQHVAFVVGVPVKPMLAKPTTGVSEVLDKFQDIEFTCEYKYDGERAQVHISEGGKVSIYRCTSSAFDI